ncbi:(Fe-S)-binding protein, partial [uncultured Muribaculum sp.]|uniref:(Fe-S)-binding protein n=1 Tax=uncultured Muribaculum sp. TaxID=1918613 RepID=UPI0026486D76
MSAIVVAVIVLGGLGVVGALVLYLVSKRFYVKEDPRIELIEQLLPGANCGSCGRSGCHDFACACASASTLDNLVCPGAGDDAMAKIAEIVNLAPVKSNPMVAVLKCNGSCANRPVTSVYDGAESCAILNSLCIGATGCAYGCLGEGDCVDVCRWNAIKMNPVTGLPVIVA